MIPFPPFQTDEIPIEVHQRVVELALSCREVSSELTSLPAEGEVEDSSQRQYLVKWKWCAYAHCSWISEAEVRAGVWVCV